MAFTHRPPDLEADITFLSTEEGGKKCAVRSNYRPSHDFGLVGMLNDAHHEFVGCESVAPGETARSTLWLLAPECQVGRFYPGFEFTVHEANHLVARGVIVAVVNPVLRAGA